MKLINLFIKEDIKKTTSLSNITNVEVINGILSDKNEDLFVYDVGVLNPEKIKNTKIDDKEYLEKVIKFGKKVNAVTLDSIFKDKKKIIKSPFVPLARRR